MGTAVAVGMIVMGSAIAAIWTRDILAGEQVDLGDGLWAARDPEAGTLFWPHWLAEYVTAAALMTAGVGLLRDATWAIGLGAAAGGAPSSTHRSIRWDGHWHDQNANRIDTRCSPASASAFSPSLTS